MNLMDLIARTITTPRGISRLSWVVSSITAISIVAFGVPLVAMIVVAWGGLAVLDTGKPWARRRLGQRY